MTLNLFYERPEADRWLPFDRYPRRVVRRVIRGRPRPGGHDLVYLNLRQGLDILGVSYRVNDFRYIRRNAAELACVIGLPHVVAKIPAETRILFGAAQFSHPNEQPGFFEKYANIAKILVPGEWVRRMWEPYFGAKVATWPVGIDTEKWKPIGTRKQIDFLIYDKVYRDRANLERELIQPLKDCLTRHSLGFAIIKYGNHSQPQYHLLLQSARAMIFLCEHETQGLAYQEALSSGVPVFAYDRGGFWTDPNFFPHIAKFEPVTSVPYWDDRCGAKFANVTEFEQKLPRFVEELSASRFDPRSYILENLTLDGCAAKYVEFVNELNARE